MILLCQSTSLSVFHLIPASPSYHVFLVYLGVQADADGRHRVFLHATADSALKTVGIDDLKKYAAEGENQTGSVRRGVVQNPPKIIDPSVGGTRGGGADN